MLPYLLMISVIFFLDLYMEKNIEDLPESTQAIVFSVWAILFSLIFINDFLLPNCFQAFNSYGLSKDILKKKILSFFIDNPNLERKSYEKELNVELPNLSHEDLLRLIPIHG